MTATPADAHDSQIVDQFTKQAEAFAEKFRSHEKAFELAIRLSGVSDQDTVLDVACGPGLVACAFAQVAQHVAGIDITPAMLDSARKLQAEKGLHNLTWELGNVEHLPYHDGEFSMIVTRYSFHHFPDPKVVLAEMMRVCKPGGKIVLIDTSPAPDKADAFNRMEKLRDPSHVRAMPVAELIGLLQGAGLTNLVSESYRWEVEIEKQLRSSFPNPGDEAKLRQIFHDDVKTDSLGLAAQQRGDEIYISYPTLIVVGVKPI